jgi:rare lipoprotein A
MIIRIFLLAIMALTLAACRGNVPRPDPSTRNADAETPVTRAPVQESDPERINANTSASPAPANNGGYLAGDGPGADTPTNLHNIPDAVPRNEPLHRYANRPYNVLGKNYRPLTATGSYKERGVASWYGKKFHGQRTSIGEVYDMYGMTAAHTTLPIPSYARVTNLQNNKSVIVRVNDRGPFLHERVIDLSYTAAAKLGIIGKGQGQVEVESLSADDYAPAPISPIYKEAIQVSPLPSDTAPAASGKAYLQLGAFSSQRGAEEFLSSMRAKLSDSGKALSLSHKNGMVKVRIGPYSSADTARATALKLEDRLGFKPVVSF